MIVYACLFNGLFVNVISDAWIRFSNGKSLAFSGTQKRDFFKYMVLLTPQCRRLLGIKYNSCLPLIYLFKGSCYECTGKYVTIKTWFSYYIFSRAGLFSHHQKQVLVIQTCNPQEVEAGAAQDRGLPDLQSGFKASVVSLVGPCLK